MQKYFKEVLHVYNQYKSYESGLAEKYNAAANSGKYNRGFLSRLKSENADKMTKYQQTTEQRLAQIRDDYAKELDARDFLSGMSLPDHLLKVLDSPIKLTERDYKALAERNKDNVTASRALHDHAAARGYVLENYIPVDTALEKFDTLIDRTKKSMWEYDAFPYYLNNESAEMDAGALCAEATKKTFECYKQPQNLEEMVSHDIKKELDAHNQTSAEFNRVFLETFTGQPIKDENGNILTESEQLDAMIHSLFDNRGGKISPEDIEYIRHDNDYTALREQNPINDSDLAKMKAAVNAAITKKSIAISNGQDVDAANAAALDAYTMIMNA